MRAFVTGGGGFIGGVVVRRLIARGDEVVATVRDPAKAAAEALERAGANLVRSDLADPRAIAEAMAGCEGVVHVAGDYRLGIAPAERAAMWDSNVGTTERVLDAAVAAGVARIVHVSTVNTYGNTHGVVVDETYRRDLARGWLSVYDETKFRAHEAAERRIADGAPISIALPGGVYGPGDHFELGRQLERARTGRLRSFAFGTTGLTMTHVEDVADGIVAVLDRGVAGRSYNLAGEPLRLREAFAIAARAGGHRPPRMEVPTAVLRAMVPLGSRFARLAGLPADMAEVISASEGVTYWASSARAAAELGFAPRDFATGMATMVGRPAG